jgi:cytochrome c peroxidase
MRDKLSRICVVCAVLALMALRALAQEQDSTLQQARALFKELPADFGDAEHPITPERVALGKALFFDPRWSADRNVGCATATTRLSMVLTR